MTAALATLTFLATLWLLVVVGAMVLERSGSKILAALKGRSTEPVLHGAPVRLRQSLRERPAFRARPRLRAAA